MFGKFTDIAFEGFGLMYLSEYFFFVQKLDEFIIDQIKTNNLNPKLVRCDITCQ